MFDFLGLHKKSSDANRMTDDSVIQACRLMESYQDSPSAGRISLLESAMTGFESAIRTYETAGLPTKKALVQSYLAKCYALLPNGNRSTNLSATIRYCLAALEHLTKDETQDSRAATLWVLANAWSQLPVGEREVNLQHSRACYFEALRFFTKKAYPQQFAMILNGLGVAYRQTLSGNRKENLNNAFRCFQEILTLCAPSQSPELWSKAHINLGNAFATLAEIDGASHLNSAIDHYQSALTIITEHNAPLEWALLMRNLSNALVITPLGNRESNCTRAITCAENALRVLTEDAFPEEWALAQQSLGWATMNQVMGDRPVHLHRAIECFSQAIRVQTKSTNPPVWAKNMQHLAAAFAKLRSGDRNANLRRALAYLEEALDVFTEDDYPQAWGSVQRDLGTVWGQLQTGQRKQNLELALSHYQAAQRTIKENIDPKGWAELQADLGTVWEQIPSGDHHANLQQAIECYQAALRVHTETAFPVDWAHRQSDLGIALQASAKLGFPAQLRRAISCYESSLRVFTKEAFPINWAGTQGNLGSAYVEVDPFGTRENIKRGIECHKRALEVYVREEFPIDWARELNNLGCAWSALSRTGESHWQEAITCFELALTVRTERDHPKDWATSLTNLAVALSEPDRANTEQEFIQAAAYFDAVLRVRTPEAMPFECAETLKNMLLLSTKNQRWEEALAHCRKLIEVAETIQRMALDDTGRRFVSRLFLGVIEEGIKAAVNCENYAAAFDLVESNKTRNLADQLWRHDVAPKGVASERWDEYRELNNRARTLSKIAWEACEFSGRSTSLHHEIDLGKVVSERQRLKAVLDSMQAQFTAIDPDYLPFSPEIDFADVASLAQSMQAVIVQLAVTDDGTYAFFCGPNDEILDSGQVVLIPTLDTSSVHRLHMEWFETYYRQRNHWNEYLEQATDQLYREIVSPIHQRLRDRYPSTKRLLLMPSRELHTFPLHAARWSAPNGDRRYLIDDYDVTYAPSCRVLRSCISRESTTSPRPDSLFAVQNPDGSLRFTDIEVELIQRSFDPTKLRVLKGSSATMQAVLDNIQHGAEKLFSTHGLFNWADADESYLMLYDGKLRVADIVQLDMEHAWLVVLSACETGRSDVIGNIVNEYYGLPSAFLAAGAHTVVASLWAVSDLSTALLMTRFHSNIYGHNLPKSTALREAQLWVRDLDAEQIDRFLLQLPFDRARELSTMVGHRATSLDRPFSHPVFWSAFQCVGAGW